MDVGAGGDGRGNARRRVRRWLGSGRERGRGKVREGTYVKQGLASIIMAPSSVPRFTAPSWLPCQRPCRQRGPGLGVRIYGAETYKLGATNDDTMPRVRILKSYL